MRVVELRHLRYFIAAAEELNISRAAARLQMSQPPLSRQIHDLENEIGTPLFDRSNKKLALTPAGAYFLREAKRILAQTQRATRTAKATGLGQAGQITVAFLSPLGGMFLPQAMRAFQRKFPLVDVNVVEMVPREQLEAVLNNAVYLALIPGFEIESADGLDSEPVMEVECRLALASDHPLSKLRRVPLARLEHERFVMLKRSAAPAMYDFLVRLCRSAGFEPIVLRQSDRAQSILDLVAAGVGVAILPEHFQRYQADFVMRPMAPKPPAISLHMVWRRRDPSPSLQALRIMIVEHCRRQSAAANTEGRTRRAQ
jgi:DNA-binding transcriptional LysR family regulator